MNKRPPDQKHPGETLNFRPLHDGLGFHPFSDGLPYAPITKTPTSRTGTGATLAGPIQVSPQILARPTAIPAGHQTFPMRTAPRTREQIISTPNTPAASPALKHAQENFGFVYLLKRIFAYAFDSVLNFSLTVIGLGAALWATQIQLDSALTNDSVFLGLLFVLCFHWALVTAQEVAFGTTVGKRIFGLTLRGSASAIFLRAFFFLPSLGFCGVGLLWAAFDSKKRCWHDAAADLQPVEIAQL